jgi:lipopolysaccharide transport system ATP-binding protein
MVIDEVLAVGDIGFQKKCLGKMSDASTGGRTVLFVSHRMDHISALCPRSVVLEGGRLVFDGKTEDALGRYYKSFDQRSGGEIAARVDRKGRGRARVVDAWIENESGQRVETVITGQPVIFKLHIRNMTGSPLHKLNAGIGIFTLGNMFAASLSAQEGGVYAFDLEDEAIISLRIPKIPLNQGQFYFNCVVRSAAGAYEFDDLVENAMVFMVDYGDFHQVGQASGGFVSIEHSASVSRLSEVASTKVAGLAQ